MAFTTAFFTLLTALLASAAAGDYVLYNGEVLMPGQNLTNGAHHLAMQTNCDLVLHHSGKPVWNSNTSIIASVTSTDCYATLKQNGEFVVRRDVHYILWTSAKKTKKGKFALVLDTAGHLGIYGQRRWTSNNPKESTSPPATLPGQVLPTSEYILHSGRRLMLGRKLKYGEFEFGLSRSCNLEINSTKSGKTLWQTNTKSASTCIVELESNGELMVRHGSQKLWSSNRKGSSGRYVAALRFDGRFAVYGPMLWSIGRDGSEWIAVNNFQPSPSVDWFKEKIIKWGMD
ncbi:Curculin-1 [Platanthera guangdongensis]|uniref:Curculin-1 n=1 Tax=Platanthera guangdongensis TaxID=2320717 RepID=A0ABR2LRZ6_9ASPA